MNYHLLLYLGGFLFCIGLLIVLCKKNAIVVLMGIELMLNASNLNLVIFNRMHPNNIEGQMFALFVIVIAVCESAIGLSIILRVYNEFKSSVPDEIQELKG